MLKEIAIFAAVKKLIPFFGIAAISGKSRPVITRIIEQSLPGIIVAFIAIYVNDAKQNAMQVEALSNLRKEVAQLRSDFEKFRDDAYIFRSDVPKKMK